MMIRYVFLVFFFFISSFIFAQNLFVAHRDYSGSPTVYSLFQLDQSSGTAQNTYDYTTSMPSSYAPSSLVFSNSTREIVGITDHLIVFYNVDNSTERSFTLASGASIDYGDIVIANNRLFVTKRDYSNSSDYKYYLVELNISTGAVIGTPYQYTTAMPDYYAPESLTYLASTNEIIGIASELVVKYNITTQAESSFTLTGGASIDYGDVVVANNRLFVTKRDYTNPTDVFYLVELNPSTGAIIGTPYQYTSVSGSYPPSSLTFLNTADEIAGIVGDLVVKYNLATGVESSYTLTSQASSDYGDLVSIDNSIVTAVVDPVTNSNPSPTIVKAWSVLGEELPINTTDRVMVVEYSNGAKGKVYKKSE